MSDHFFRAKRDGKVERGSIDGVLNSEHYEHLTLIPTTQWKRLIEFMDMMLDGSLSLDQINEYDEIVNSVEESNCE